LLGDEKELFEKPERFETRRRYLLAGLLIVRDRWKRTTEGGTGNMLRSLCWKGIARKLQSVNTGGKKTTDSNANRPDSRHYFRLTNRGMITSSQERDFRALDNMLLCSQRFLPRCYARDFTFPACLLPPYRCLSRIKFPRCRDLPI